ncbi:hypothetical protein KJ562_00395 [Patescibacteria group bacterium]|nr:hypothetical protein [Patescibacteria group bacterium]MBU4162061.1 hypothetical protein [Patescibacteria group bacterium]
MKLKNFLIISKRKILLWLVFAFTMIFIPLHPIRAQWGIEILTAPFVLLAKLVTLCIVGVPVSFWCLDIAQIFLTWAANPALVGGVTNNPFVLAGWATIRDFSNLFFILIIVAIGIATALRVKQYEVRKTLPRLIIVAVLINFSPVICGVFIDAANIIANFFFTAGAGGFSDVITIAQSSKGWLVRELSSISGVWAQIRTGELFFKAIAVLVFNLFGTFVLFLMGILFIVRNLALWILVILSPLAFLSSIFPKNPVTKKATPFGMWRDQFVKWTFVGVTGSFFLYLAQLMMRMGTKTLLNNNLPATHASDAGGNIITGLMVMAVPLVFLGIGYFVTVSSSAMGAGAITNFGKKGLAWGKSKAGGMAINRLRKDIVDPYKRAGQKVGERIANKAPGERAERYKQSHGIAKVGKTIARGAIPYSIREWGAAKLKPGLAERGVSNVEKAKDEAGKLKTKEGRRAQYNKAKREKNREKQLGVVVQAIEKGELDGYSDGEIQSAIKDAGQINKKLAEDIIQATPNLAQEIYDDYHADNPNIMTEYNNLNTQLTTANAAGNQPLAEKLERQMDRVKQPADSRGLWMSPEDIQHYGTFEAKTVLTTKAKDIGKLRKNYVKTNRFMEIAQDASHQGKNALSGNHLSKIAEEYGTSAVDLYNDTSDRINPTGRWMADIAPDRPHPIKRYLDTNPGAIAAGYRMPTTGGGTGGGGGGGGTILTPSPTTHVKTTSQPKMDERQRAEMEEERRRKSRETGDKGDRGGGGEESDPNRPGGRPGYGGGSGRPGGRPG